MNKEEAESLWGNVLLSKSVFENLGRERSAALRTVEEEFDKKHDRLCKQVADTKKGVLDHVLESFFIRYEGKPLYSPAIGGTFIARDSEARVLCRDKLPLKVIIQPDVDVSVKTIQVPLDGGEVFFVTTTVPRRLAYTPVSGSGTAGRTQVLTFHVGLDGRVLGAFIPDDFSNGATLDTDLSRRELIQLDGVEVCDAYLFGMLDKAKEHCRE